MQNESDSQSDTETPVETKRNYRAANMQKARLARLEKIKQQKEIKAKQPKKVLEYNIESESDEYSSESEDDTIVLPKPKKRARATPPRLKRQNGYYKEETSAEYDPRDMAMMQMQMAQLQKSVKRKARKPIKKQTVVQVLQPAHNEKQQGGRSSQDIMLDALLGK